MARCGHRGPELDVAFLAAGGGAFFGALAVAVRWGLLRVPEPEVGAFVAAAVGAVTSATVAAPSAVTEGLKIGELWPFFAAGLIAPGASQIFLTLAVRHAGAARAAILMGSAPLIAILIALLVLGEPFRPLLGVATLLIVSGGFALAGEQRRVGHRRVRGSALALLCAALFATRDNILRWGARGHHDPPPLVEATASLLAAAALILVYVVLTRRDRLRTRLATALPAFAPAGLALALAYCTLLAAFDQGRVSIVSPLSATGSLWAVVLAAVVIGRSEEVERRTALAALLIVAGGALIGTLR
jgi:drug/metabolite transporter (DMT)-like permease